MSNSDMALVGSPQIEIREDSHLNDCENIERIIAAMGAFLADPSSPKWGNTRERFISRLASTDEGRKMLNNLCRKKDGVLQKKGACNGDL